MLKLFLRMSFLSILLFSAASYGLLNLELTQGVQGAIPIAVVPFSGQANDLQADNNLAGVITTDLQNSGRFNLMNANKMQQSPASAADVDFSYWQKQDVNNMVVGDVKSLGGGKYQVNVQLMNVFGNKENAPGSSAPAWKNAIMMSKTYTVNENQLRSLAHHVSDDIYQALTGDRGIFSTRIAYVMVNRTGLKTQYSLEIADYDGRNPKPLLKSSQPIMSPSWAPNGHKIAYVSFESGDPAIFIQDVGTGARQKVSGYAGLNGAPAWSPDGHKLAMVLSQSGYPKIYIMSLGSNRVTQLTNGSAIDTEPSWSPDGQSVLFTSNRGGGPQIYRVNVASGDVQRLTFSGNYNARASFVPPEGKSVVVLNGGGNAYNIAVQDLSTGRYTVLTGSGNDQSPSVAPNGKMVVYATHADGHGVLGVVSLDGKVKQLLPAREGDVREPAWSPFTS
jgi:TolB protein